MKRRLSLLLIAVVVMLSFGASAQPANAAPTSITSNCSSVTVTGSTTSFSPVTAIVIDPITLGPLGNNFVFSDLVGNYTINVAIPAQAAGKVLMVNVFDGGITSTTITCGSVAGSGTTFFNPNDGRVDPNPGDRLAIWCNTSGSAPNLLIYGVASDSKGFMLTKVNFADILKAGNPRYNELKAKLAKLLKSGNPDPIELDNLMAEARREAKMNVLVKRLGGNGTLFIVVDDQNNLTVSWTGGPYGANGQGAFVKNFKCGFSR